MLLTEIKITVPENMYNALKEEMELRHLDTIKETVRQIISEYLRAKSQEPGEKKPYLIGSGKFNPNK
jgi:metal-responsive CopG/Arc/MetJ family transcriptional regulator